MGFLFKAGLLGAVLAASSPLLMSRWPRWTGTVPMWHVGIAHGYALADVPDLTGKIALVTGANSGLGKGTAIILAKHGAVVYGTCRSPKRCAEAAREIDGDFRPMHLDLSSLQSVADFVAEFKKRESKIDFLDLNAGVMAPPYGLTEDGLETQFGVNHLAHFKLAQELLPLVVQAAPGSRIVAVASVAQYFTPKHGVGLTLDQINDEANYDSTFWYGQSKLANVLFAQELSERVRDKGVYVNSIHPGGVKGNLTRHVLNYNAGSATMKNVDDFFQNIFYWDIETAALTTLYPLVSPEIEKGDGVHGQYFVPVARQMSTCEHARNATLQKELWRFSEELLAAWDLDHGAFKKA